MQKKKRQKKKPNRIKLRQTKIPSCSNLGQVMSAIPSVDVAATTWGTDAGENNL